MTDKLLTLLNGDSVILSANKKVLSAQEYGQLCSAQELIENIRLQAVNYKKEIARECEQLKEQAEREGFERGMLQWVGQIKHLAEHFSSAKCEIEKTIIQVALSAAKKIVGREIELNPATVADIVAAQLKTVHQCKQIVIYVNPADFNLINAQRALLKDSLEKIETLLVKTRDDIELGGFIIDTEIGILNLKSVDTIWKPIEAMFESFADLAEAPSAEQPEGY